MNAHPRRTFLIGAACMTAAAAMPRPLAAQAAEGPFKLPPLPYKPDALAPHIDARTMEIHHGRHHAAYVANLNRAVSGHGELAKRPLDDILANLAAVPDDIRTTIRNNAGGHANHSMFWEVIGGGGGDPDGELADAVTRDLGGVETMRKDFNEAGGRVFGSGWVFVTVDGKGRLAIETRPNQDTPLMDGRRVLFGNDVWEHAYYLTYQNRRPDYLKAWWNVVNWERIADRYSAAVDGTLKI